MKIGNIELKNKIVLAPMAGISTPSYIKILEEMGIAYAVSELISSEAIVRNNKKTLDMLKGIEKIKIPVAVQIFGSDPKVMASSAKIITNLYKNIIIDINAGCPVPKVAIKSKSGSALLKDLELLERIIKSVKEAVDVPVTVKIRSGWDKNEAVKIAKVVEKANADAITIHPRTRIQGYSGKADWSIIKEVKQNVNIPVIGNGDVRNYQDYLDILKTNCDAVMIGRAFIGNPWLVKEILNKKNIEIKPNERLDILVKHLNYSIENKNEKTAILELRSQIMPYLKGFKTEDKQKIFKATTKEDFMNTINELKNQLIYK